MFHSNQTYNFQVPLCFAAAHNHIDCLRFLLKQKHDTHALMEDRKVVTLFSIHHFNIAALTVKLEKVTLKRK